MVSTDADDRFEIGLEPFLVSQGDKLNIIRPDYILARGFDRFFLGLASRRLAGTWLHNNTRGIPS